MAKKNMIEREKKRERLINKYEKKRKEIKESLKIADSYEARLSLYAKMEKLPNNSAPCRHRNRCWLTGRSRGYYRDFGLSRKNKQSILTSILNNKENKNVDMLCCFLQMKRIFINRIDFLFYTEDKQQQINQLKLQELNQEQYQIIMVLS